MTVVSLQPLMVCDLTVDHARSLGVRLTTDVQRLALGLPVDTPAAQVNMRARSDQSTVWLTTWVRVVSDSVRLVRNAGMQAPSGPLQWRSLDAGEAVHEDYQREYISGPSSTTWEGKRADRLEESLKARRARKAKGTVAHRESTRRRRIESTRDQA